jgi:BASS family bile acid:Na+ symporter
MLKRVLGFYTKYFAVWVIVFGVVAYFWPGPFIALEGCKKLFFGLTMFGIGAVLQIEDFKRILQKPIIVLIGCCSQFTFMPLGAFLLARAFGFSPELTAGLILTGSAPGAMASNVMSYIARADTAYSVSLTTVSTLLCPILTPVLTLVLASSAMKVSFEAMMLDIIYMVIAPLFVGFGVRHYLREKVEEILPVFPAISVTFIIFICSLVIALNKDHLAEVTGVILAAGLILNIYGMLAGYAAGSVFRMNTHRRWDAKCRFGCNSGSGASQ